MHVHVGARWIEVYSCSRSRLTEGVASSNHLAFWLSASLSANFFTNVTARCFLTWSTVCRRIILNSRSWFIFTWWTMPKHNLIWLSWLSTHLWRNEGIGLLEQDKVILSYDKMNSLGRILLVAALIFWYLYGHTFWSVTLNSNIQVSKLCV